MMVKLQSTAGLDVDLETGTGELCFGDGVEFEKLALRSGRELEPVLRDPASATARTAYLMWRGVHQTENRELLAAHALRYDLTVTLPGTWGDEYAKTAGHLHEACPRSGIPFCEIYEVVHGRAIFMLQRAEVANPASNAVQDIRVFTARVGDKLLIPPAYAHITVNVGDEPLVVADLISTQSQNLYGSLKQCRGMACYVLQEADAPHLVPNVRYVSAALPVLESLSDSSEFFIPEDVPLYQMLRRNPEQMKFLNHPHTVKEVMPWPNMTKSPAH